MQIRLGLGLVSDSQRLDLGLVSNPERLVSVSDKMPNVSVSSRSRTHASRVSSRSERSRAHPCRIEKCGLELIRNYNEVFKYVIIKRWTSKLQACVFNIDTIRYDTIYTLLPH